MKVVARLGQSKFLKMSEHLFCIIILNVQGTLLENEVVRKNKIDASTGKFHILVCLFSLGWKLHDSRMHARW